MLKKLSLVLLIALLGCSSDTSDNHPLDSVVFPLRMKFSTIGGNGIFDPSVALDPSTDNLWMSYSQVHPSVMWPVANPEVVGIRLASSTDGGKSWSDSGIDVSEAHDVTVTTPNPEVKEGTWMSEVSQILYDPWETDSNKRWKMVWHHYLRLDHVTLTAAGMDSRLFQHGWIGLKEAATPAGLALAAEVKLFAAGGYDAENDNSSGNTQSPVGGPPAIEYHTMTGTDSYAITEPGLLAAADGIFMSVVSFDASANSAIHLLKYSRTGGIQDSGSWTYLGSPLAGSDAASMGYAGFSASELFEIDGETYLLVSPVTDVPWDGAYNGCMTFRFADLNAAALEGSPTAIDFFQGDAGSFNGACEYNASLSYGFIYGQVYPADSEKFRLYHSGILP